MTMTTYMITEFKYCCNVFTCLMLTAGGELVPLLIGALRSTGIMLSRILGPLSVPLVSFITTRNNYLINHCSCSLHNESEIIIKNILI